MGEALFERKHQALSLTIAGERLLEAVAPLIDDLGRIFDSMSGPHELRLRVGVLPLFASHVLMPQLPRLRNLRSEEHTSELQSLMRISYAVFCLKKTNNTLSNNRCTHI